MRVVIQRLPVEALDWSPATHMNSIAILVAHAMGAERYWIGDVTVRQGTERVRDTEFQVNAQDHDTLIAMLDDALADAKTALAALSIKQLSEERVPPSQSDRSFTVGWCLLHAMEHTAQHMGHVQLMGDMWEVLHNQ